MSKIPATAFSICLLLLSGWIANAEFQAALHHRSLNLLPIPRPPSVDTSTPWTLTTARDLLSNCDVALRPDWATLAPRLTQKANNEACLNFATRINSHWPDDAVAKLVAASVHLHKRHTEKFTVLIRQSQAAAPNEGWLAERRLTLLLHGSEYDDLARMDRLIEHELAVLLRTQSGAELLATYYLYRPQLRDSLTLALNKAQAADQKRFLNQLHLRGLS